MYLIIFYIVQELVISVLIAYFNDGATLKNKLN